MGLIEGHLDQGCQGVQLLHRCGSVNVRGNEIRNASVFLQQPTQFGNSRGFATSMKAHEHEGDRRVPRKVNLAVFSPHEIYEFLVHDLDNLLCRR